MRTVEFIEIDGQHEVYGVYQDGVFIKFLRRLIRNW